MYNERANKTLPKSAYEKFEQVHEVGFDFFVVICTFTVL